MNTVPYLNDGAIETLLDRHEAHIPDSFVPSAKAIAVGTDQLLMLVGWKVARDARRRSSRWVRLERGSVFTGLTAASILRIRLYGTLWSIERELWCQTGKDVLAVTGHPIFFRDYKAAMALALHCDPEPPDKARHYLAWVPREEVPKG